VCERTFNLDCPQLQQTEKITKGTFKYHMALQGGEGFAQIVRMPSYGRGRIWSNRHITFVVAEKA